MCPASATPSASSHASITAAARLMLALLEREVTKVGGSYAFCDTDSLAIVATPRRRKIDVGMSRHMRAGLASTFPPRPNGNWRLVADSMAPYSPGATITFPVEKRWRTPGREFPWQNLKLDGFAGTSPVGSFAPNCHGLCDITGNVWEWTSDWYSAEHHTQSACCVPTNPRVTNRDSSYAPEDEPGSGIPRKVIKGGSHLCAPNYCLRYRPAARQPQMIDTGIAHLGFRCIVRPR